MKHRSANIPKLPGLSASCCSSFLNLRSGSILLEWGTARFPFFVSLSYAAPLPHSRWSEACCPVHLRFNPPPVTPRRWRNRTAPKCLKRRWHDVPNLTVKEWGLTQRSATTHAAYAATALHSHTSQYGTYESWWRNTQKKLKWNLSKKALDAVEQA